MEGNIHKPVAQYYKFVDRDKAYIEDLQNPNTVDDDRKHIKHYSNNNFKFNYIHIFYTEDHKLVHLYNFYKPHSINIVLMHTKNIYH